MNEPDGCCIPKQVPTSLTLTTHMLENKWMEKCVGWKKSHFDLPQSINE